MYSTRGFSNDNCWLHDTKHVLLRQVWHIVMFRCFSYESSQRVATVASSPPHSSVENKTFDWDETSLLSQKYVSSTLNHKMCVKLYWWVGTFKDIVSFHQQVNSKYLYGKKIILLIVNLCSLNLIISFTRYPNASKEMWY